jgi:hypothetical protein
LENSFTALPFAEQASGRAAFMSKDDGGRLADELRVAALKRIVDIRSDAEAHVTK